MPTVSRLIEYFVPEHYQLSLELNRLGRNFRGTVTIRGTSQPQASGIFLHAKDLHIESALIDGRIATVTLGQDDSVQLAQDSLEPGTHTVVLGFSGHITDAMNGLYPCYYEHAGVKKELLATQFESHHAREVFPCIDEPEAKATFDLTLTTEESVTTLSNMPVLSQDSDGHRMVTTFERTPRMSTYLLAFVVGELQARTARTKNDVEIAIWSTPAQPPESLDYALDVAVRTTEFFEEYFDMPYPLPKCDHVALPDFAAGAMENWGLITYRETALLAPPDTTSLGGRQYIVRVVAHEISHQWFGDLVTMKWWNNLWLNESFATLMMYLSVESTHPEWDTWLEFSTSQSILALERDSIDGVQPVQTEVHHPDEINTLFDSAIVYAKGARLLRMLQHYIGEEAFRAGLQAYFKQYAYSNTEGDDLWQAFTTASGKDIVGLMNTWISQPGYPVVHMSQNEQGITLTQEQFFVGPHQPSERLWPIPLDSTAPELPQLLGEASLTTPNVTPPVRLNQADSAHFVTHYSDELFQDILSQLQAGALPVITRLQILNETAILARGGVVPVAQLIPLLRAYTGETSEHVWQALLGTFAELRKFVEGDEAASEAHRQLAIALAWQHYDHLGWTPVAGEPESHVRLRTIAIGLMLYGEDPAALDTAHELYTTTPLEQLNPDLRPAILKAVVRSGDSDIVDTLTAAYRATTTPELRMDIAQGLAATRIPAKITELLDMQRDASAVRPQDTRRWYMQLMRSYDSRELSWQWLRDNWEWVVTTFKSSMSYDDFPRIAASTLSTPEQLAEFKEFFGPMADMPALNRVITMGMGEIEGRIELIEQNQAAVRSALES